MFTTWLLRTQKISTCYSYLYSDVNPVNLILFILLLFTYFIFIGVIPKFYMVLALMWALFDKLNAFSLEYKSVRSLKIVLRHIPLNIVYTFLWIVVCTGITLYKCVRLYLCFFLTPKAYIDDLNNLFMYRPASGAYGNALNILIPELITITILFVYMMTNTRRFDITKNAFTLMAEKSIARGKPWFTKYLNATLVFVAMSISLNIFTFCFGVFFVLDKFRIGKYKNVWKGIILLGFWLTSLASIVVPFSFVSYEVEDTIHGDIRLLLGLFDMQALFRGVIVSLNIRNKFSYLLIINLAIYYLNTKSLSVFFRRLRVDSIFDSYYPTIWANSTMNYQKLKRDKKKPRQSVQIESTQINPQSSYVNYFMRNIAIIMNLKDIKSIESSKYLQSMPGFDYKYFQEAYKAHEIITQTNPGKSSSRLAYLRNFLNQRIQKILSFTFIVIMIILINFLQNVYTLIFLVYVITIILHDNKFDDKIEAMIRMILRITGSICFLTFIISNMEVSFLKDNIANNFLFRFFGFYYIDNKDIVKLIFFLQMFILQLNQSIASQPESFGFNEIMNKYFELGKSRSVQFTILKILYYPARVLFYISIIIFESTGDGFTFFRLFSIALFLLSMQFDIQRTNNDFILKLLIYLYMIIRFTIFIVFRINLLNLKFMSFFGIKIGDENFFSSNYGNFIKLLLFGLFIKLKFLKAKFEAEFVNLEEPSPISPESGWIFFKKLLNFIREIELLVRNLLFHLVIMIGFAVIQMNITYLVLLVVASILLLADATNLFLILPKNNKSGVRLIEFLSYLIFYLMMFAIVVKMILCIFL